jgi:hypothetical protein
MDSPPIFIGLALGQIHGLFADGAEWTPSFVRHNCLLLGKLGKGYGEEQVLSVK